MEETTSIGTAPLWFRGCLSLIACGMAAYLCRGQIPFLHSTANVNLNRRCETAVHDRVLPDTVVARLQSVPNSSPRAPVESLLGEPYCRLPNLATRVDRLGERLGERYLYQQAGEPHWLIVLYEGGQYVGFSVSSQPPLRSK